MRPRLTTGLPLSQAHTDALAPASTFPKLAMNAPYTESQSYAIPLGENVHTERCPVCTSVTCSFAQKTNHLLTQGQMVVSEKVGFFPIKTLKSREGCLELLREATHPQRP